MANYEVALVFGLFALSFYLLELSQLFKVEGSTATKALINGIMGLLLRMFSVGTVFFNVFFIRLILQDQTQTASIISILKIYDGYLQVFIYIFGVVFFITFFAQQLVNLTENFKIYQYNKQIEAGNRFARK